MKKILKYTMLSAILLSLAGWGVSCKEKEKNEDCFFIFDVTHDNSASIIEKWKLVKYRVHSRLGEFCTDLSENNIMYEFKANDVVTISAEKNFSEISTGEYNYSFFSVTDQDGTVIDRLSIGEGDRWYYRISSTELLLEASSSAGITYYFIKIN
jgi:hypothetical protein